MDLKVRVYGDPVLRQKAQTITDFDDDLKALADEMLRAMYLHDGTGLAAPQVGESVRLALVDLQDGEGPFPIINPEIVESASEKIKGEEGCLSFPDIYEDIERPRWIRVRYQDLEGNQSEKELRDFAARVVCHELDHLNGVLMIDHISYLKRKMLKKRLIELREKADQMASST